MTIDERKSLLEENRRLVPRLVQRAIHRYGLETAMRDFLTENGNVGLVEAAARFEPSHGDFALFARQRIAGEIIWALWRYYGYEENLPKGVSSLAEKDCQISPERASVLRELM